MILSGDKRSSVPRRGWQFITHWYLFQIFWIFVRFLWCILTNHWGHILWFLCCSTFQCFSEKKNPFLIRNVTPPGLIDYGRCQLPYCNPERARSTTFEPTEGHVSNICEGGDAYFALHGSCPSTRVKKRDLPYLIIARDSYVRYHYIHDTR